MIVILHSKVRQGKVVKCIVMQGLKWNCAHHVYNGVCKKAELLVMCPSSCCYTDRRVIRKEDDSDDIVLCLGDFLAFVTGADHPPPLGFMNSPEVEFCDDPSRTLPRASTCSLVFYLSLHVTDYDLFCAKMDEAINLLRWIWGRVKIYIITPSAHAQQGVKQ